MGTDLASDLLLDRHRLKRQLVFWRVLTLLGFALAALAAVKGEGLLPVGRHVARLSVSGIISSDPPLLQAIYRLADEPKVAALIVDIDSPGGTVEGGEELHDAIAAVARKKPVVAVMRGMAASAGYMIALPAARIFARGTTITGSIGVFLQTAEISGLLERLGIKTEAIVSGPLKDQPSLTRPLSLRARQALEGLVQNLFDQFVAMVAADRHMDPVRVRELADGRAYTGEQALRLGLVDALGGETMAREWLAAHGVPASLPIENVEEEASGWLGLVSHLADFTKTLFSQGVSLDGAWALWQPSRLNSEGSAGP